MSKRNLISQYQADVDGQRVTVNVFKSKEKKAVSYGRTSVTTCPNCLSKLQLNESGVAFCTGDKLQFWVQEFIKFDGMSDEKKVEYIQSISDHGEFINLYDRWKWQNEQEYKEIFNCGYTNKIFLPMPSGNIIIPDPVKVAYVMRKLGRDLTEEELFGENELWEFGGSIYPKYRNGARKVKIAMVRFPQDC